MSPRASGIIPEVLGQIFGIDRTFETNIDGWIQLVHPEDRPQMLGHYANEVVGQHKRFNKEYRIIRPCDGEVRWVHGLGELSSIPRARRSTCSGPSATSPSITRAQRPCSAARSD
ncbi:MAG: PAS domain-containing protein [Fibrobacteres bacterium]|nr:PAS domain-containing protein [Fibrobacterota bacterium]